MLRFDCPACKATLECPEERRGAVIRCPGCGQKLQIPGQAAAKRGSKIQTGKPKSSPSLTAAPPPPAPPPTVERGSGAHPAFYVLATLLVVAGLAAAGGTFWLLQQRREAEVAKKTDDSTAPSAPSSRPAPTPAPASEVEPPEWTPPVPGEPLREPRIEEQVVVDARGDAWITRAFQMPLSAYTIQKENTSNVALLERDLRLKQTWRQVEALKARFDDRSSTLVVRWRVRGYARPQDAGAWTVPVPRGLSMVHSAGNEAALSGKTTSDLDGSAVLRTSRVKLPETARDISLHGPIGLGYRYTPPAATASGEATVKFDLDVRPHLLACLGQVYARPRNFGQFWVARAVLRNTGRRTLQNYRVRFRIEGYMDAADEHRCAVVVPGQSVVDASFPVLDLEKLAALTTPVPATLVAEYEYELADGRTVKERVSRSLQILSRNMILSTDLRPEEVVTFYDGRRIFPHVMAAIVTKNDNVVRQLAGWVSGWAAEILGSEGPGAIAASESEQEARLFMKLLHAFMRDSIKYQTPPGELIDGKFSQHVKYGRDVLENKAGTCVDLAILFASVCEAVGLEAVIVSPPGHAFPAIRMPKSGNLVGVETTWIGPKDTFEDAVGEGMKKIAGLRPGRFITANIASLRKDGLQGLILPDKKLETMGFVKKLPPVLLRRKTADGKTVLVTVGGNPGGSASSGTTGGGTSEGGSGRGMFGPTTTPVSLVGRWQASGYEGRLFAKSELSLSKDGKYTYSKAVFNNQGAPLGSVNRKGTYKTSRESIVFKDEMGEEEVCPYQARGETFLLTIKTPMGNLYPQFRKVPE